MKKEIWLLMSGFGIMFAVFSWLQESGLINNIGWLKGFFALIWILPPIALILGLGAITFVVRRLRHSRPEAELERLVQPQKMKLKIRKSLSMIDQELGENFDIK